ncbi:hypothetical protein [Ralstonia pseudosolanacearum]|uniref:hypothetical protein n=1 Tax=Ralstonia pseudosolanacearum TaxID=1310165 RepID=UPI00399D57E0
MRIAHAPIWTVSSPLPAEMVEVVPLSAEMMSLPSPPSAEAVALLLMRRESLPVPP